MIICKRKAKKRLSRWMLIRQVVQQKQLRLQEEKQALLDKYEINEFQNGVFYCSRSEHDVYSFIDNDFNELSYEIGSILPYIRRGDMVFFFEIINTFRKYGDYGFSDYGYFWDLKFSYTAELPQKKVDPKRSVKISWDKVAHNTYFGNVQGIRVVKLEPSDSYFSKIDAIYLRDNFENHRELPRRQSSFSGVVAAKKEIQQAINNTIKNGYDIRQFYIPTKI